MNEAWTAHGYLVRFGRPDLVDDQFGPWTDFEADWQKRIELPVYFAHIGDEVLPDRIGEGRLELAGDGIKIHALLSLPPGTGRILRKLSSKSQLGWSSAAMPYRVKRETVGGVKRIMKWPLMEASITVAPCAPLPQTVVGLRRSSWEKEGAQEMARTEMLRGEMLAAEIERMMEGR
jgi:hypothetical protein